MLLVSSCRTLLQARGSRPRGACYSRFHAAILSVVLLTTLPGLNARAALQDEIQVYDDGINAPGEFGLELHVNTTPSGNGAPSYPGEVTSLHGARFTGEFSYGLSRDFEAGMYIPTAIDANGSYHLAGTKLRLKWLPLHDEPGVNPWFAGSNFEFARVGRRFEAARYAAEEKLIGGYRTQTWLIAANLNLDWELAGHTADSEPDLNSGLKIVRTLCDGVATGIEYYSDFGKLTDRLSLRDQDHRLFLVVDVNRKPWVFDFGVGRGLTDAADHWTIKAIFEIPL